MENPFQSDADFAAAVRAKSTRRVLGEFVAALGELVIHLDLPHAITTLSVNYHGHQQRVDIATLTPDGQHLDEWLVALNADPVSPSFAARVDLPSLGPVQ
jgi:hypothetical protein